MTEQQSTTTSKPTTVGQRLTSLMESPMGSAYLATACTGFAICIIAVGMSLVNVALS